jgi:hypothetical protein
MFDSNKYIPNCYLHSPICYLFYFPTKFPNTIHLFICTHVKCTKLILSIHICILSLNVNN